MILQCPRPHCGYLQWFGDVYLTTRRQWHQARCQTCGHLVRFRIPPIKTKSGGERLGE